MVGFARATDLAIDSAPLQARFHRDISIFSPRRDPQRPLWEPSRAEFQRQIGALAIDWLVGQTSEAALQQYARTRFAGDWRGAFRDAFGMSVDQFTREFAAYRAELAAADGGGPRLSRPFHHVVFIGELTDERRALVPATEAIVDFFARAYGLHATTATFVLDIDEPTYEHILGTIGHHFCGTAQDDLIYVLDACAFPFTIAHEFVHVLLDEHSGSHQAERPTWLVEGATEYLARRWWLAERAAPHETGWDIPETFAAELIQELSQGPTALLATASDAEAARAAIEGDEQYHVYALAVRHLVERFGIDTLFAIFGPRWSRAAAAGRFQAVAGESLDAFYASFGAWLRTLPAPPPDLWTLPPPCADHIAETDRRGVAWVHFDTLEEGCITVRDGGIVTVRRGDAERTFTLYGGWDWLVVDATTDIPAVQFVTPANPYLGISSGAIRFALDDGRELSRWMPADTLELDAIFDAIVRLSAPAAD